MIRLSFIISITIFLFLSALFTEFFLNLKTFNTFSSWNDYFFHGIDREYRSIQRCS